MSNRRINKLSHIEISKQSALLERSLERAAESIGDITQPVIERFYKRYPQVRAIFEHWGLGRRAQLEADMVETALYCVMEWIERPSEVSILLGTSVPHHRDTLQVKPEWYGGLLGTVLEVIVETIPHDETAELAVMEEIRAGLNSALTN